MQALTFVFVLVVVLALFGVIFWLVRRFAGNRLGANTQRGRMPRLAVIDAAAVDGRRRLVLVRRDNVEHLLMIGGPTDIVVEPNIVRAAASRDQLPYRPAGAAEPPSRISPLPDALGEEEFPHPEPQMPEPPPRPVRPAFAEEMRRAAPPPMPMPDRRAEPLPAFPPEPIVRAERGEPLGRIEPVSRPEPMVRPEPRLEPRVDRPEPLPPRMPRSEPLMPRANRLAEGPKPPPMRERPVAITPPPPTAPPPPPAPPPASSADQNLAEMAQRLEAALRRPSAPANEAAPPVAPEPPPPRAGRAEPPPAPGPAKTSFENLEDEMASLLGRPKSSSS